MTSTFSNVGLFIRKDDPVMEHAVVKVVEFLNSKSINVLINEPLRCVAGIEVISTSDFPQKCDLTIAIGGDGTILSAARLLAGSELAVVGVNVGRLGFLADVTLAHLEQELEDILSGDFREDTRFLLSASMLHSDSPIGTAMNDVVIHTHQSINMIEFETYINGRFLNSQRADGLVISTPTGSTAYAMSAGGPILDVDIDAVCLVSVCPHTLSNRPLVISATNTIDIILSEQTSNTALVTCDGRPGHILQPGQGIRIQRHSANIKLLHLSNHDHYSILRAKLEWGKKLT
jgi:NAD+ kinase